MQEEEIVTCKICGRQFFALRPVEYDLECGQRCPHCGIWIPVQNVFDKKISKEE